MKIRINFDAAINTKADAETILNWIWTHKAKFSKPGPNEDAILRILKCYHDETPTKPCDKIFENINGKWTWLDGVEQP